MRHTLLSLPVLMLVLAACGDDAPVVADPDDLELEIVSGDGQVAMVSIAGGAPAAALAPAQTVPDNVLPERLVARITIDGEQPQASLGALAGPSFDVLPANVNVTYRVIQPDSLLDTFGPTPCGQSFIDSAIPDDSGYVATYWERGTWAGDCTMEVRLVTDAGPVVDTVFTATFTPGPVASFTGITIPLYDWTITEPDRFASFARERALDQHGNSVPWRLAVSGTALVVPSTDFTSDSSHVANIQGAGSDTIRILTPSDTIATGTATVTPDSAGRLWVTILFTCQQLSWAPDCAP